MDPQTLVQLMMTARAGGGDSSAMLQQLVSSSDDPTLRAFATVLGQQQAAERDASEDDDEADNEELERRAGELTARLEQVQDTLRRVVDELQAMRDRNELLAQALGACPRCWGSEAACEICGGAGRAGSIEPNPPLFAKFVVPALRRMTEAQRRGSMREMP